MIAMMAIGLLLGDRVAAQAPAAWETTISYNMASSADADPPKYEMYLSVDNDQSGQVIFNDFENRLRFNVSRCRGMPIDLYISIGASSSLPLADQIKKFRESLNLHQIFKRNVNSARQPFLMPTSSTRSAR